MQRIKIERFHNANNASSLFPDLFHTYKVLLNLTNYQAAKAVSIHLGVCRNCHAAPRSCQCGNDE